jgi:hypothetical protein
MAKRKRSTVVDTVHGASMLLPPPIAIPPRESSIKKRASRQRKAHVPVDLPAPPANALNGSIVPSLAHNDELEFPLSDVPEPQPSKRRKAAPSKKKGESEEVTETPKSAKGQKDGIESLTDPEAEGYDVVDEKEIKQVLSRPPPVNSDYLPLPWKGRLGYVRFFNSNHPIEMLTISRPA